MAHCISALAEQVCFGTDNTDHFERIATSGSGSTLAGSSSTFTDHEKVLETTIEETVDSNDRSQGLIRPLLRLKERWLPRYPNTWTPTFLQLRPLAAIAGLIIAVLGLVASLIILTASDGRPTESWLIQPTVYLAIVTAIANSALALAFHQAAPVSWWYNASRGRTVRTLERQWQITNSFLCAILHSRHLCLLNIACIVASLVVIDGPLLQKASTVVRATSVHNATLAVSLPAELPTGFSGLYRNGVLWETQVANNLGWQWTRSTPITLHGDECEGSV